MSENLTENAERVARAIFDDMRHTEAMLKKAIPRPFGHVKVPRADRIQKYIDFRVGLTAAELGDEQAFQAVGDLGKQYGRKALYEEIVETHPMFEEDFKSGEAS